MTYKTPMLQQWAEAKEQYPDCLLFFRLGDFYELFGDDAKIGSEVLHITLTARDKGADGKIPMCGVPFHASENYIARLVNAGYKVAICEQVSEPGKGLVKREVVRVVTAGTLLRDESLTEATSQYMLSLMVDPPPAGKLVAGAAADLSTGQFKFFSFTGDPEQLLPLIISHFAPREVVVPRSTYDNRQLMALIRSERSTSVTCAHDWLIYIKDAEKLLKTHFKVSSLDAFGLTKKPAAIKSVAALLGYLRYTQKGNIEHITSLQEFHFDGHLILDQTTLRHLEVVRTMEGEVAGSLFGTLNQTVTAAGQRLLQDWLLHPLTDLARLTARQDAITELLSRRETVAKTREALAHLSDVERLVGRLSVGLGTPRDLRRLADTLAHAQTSVLPLLAGVKAARLQFVAQALPDQLLEWVTRARTILFEEAKPTLDEGYIFTAGYRTELDQLRQMTSGNQTWLADFETRERERTGIPKLRVVYSRAFGYAIEVTKPFKDRVPADYIPRQTLVNAERYTCQALADYERKAVSALDQMVALERELFGLEVQQMLTFASLISEVAQRLAELDVLLTFTTIAHTHNYVRPKLTSETQIRITGGRHPVIEQLSEAPFVANDTSLSPEASLQLITGPNMAGKSTFLRQVALIVLMAHTGCFVSANEAAIGITDRIFTRIGAHDNLRAGQSTFMVEMLETAHIIHNATERSLTILDEVGRGTSPEDGFALAWAIAESLVAVDKGLVLFATHFHALKEIAENQPKVFNSHLAVAVDNDDLIFLRKITSGPTDESYGIVVAEKAGIPKPIIERAKQVASLGDHRPKRPTRSHGETVPNNPNQLPLLGVASQPTPIEIALAELNLNEVTPLQALTLLHALKEKL